MTEQDRKRWLDAIEEMASQGLRTLVLAYKDMNSREQHVNLENSTETENGVTLLGLVGIKDPLRPEVIQAVSQCKKSGIVIRMVTGDNLLTAQFIARECGILLEDGICMTGQEFCELNDHELDQILPQLQVLARSTPDDKLRLVKRLRENGRVVAMTGDGTNDGLALKEADVGLSMGLSGTMIAKEASDIVILDDNFSSIVKSVLWGRSIYENIRKFLMFQLTVNVCALLVTIVTAVAGMIMKSTNSNNSETHTDPSSNTSFRLEPPLTAIQLLWVNLIMDTFAALALATEPPYRELLDRKPYGRHDAIITKNMWFHICGQSLYQFIVLVLLYVFGGMGKKYEGNCKITRKF
ncbi:hypothetical protein C9374_005958 [Naegleria lovaniensis]|uniref:PH domain-containing protein n=1 Tax=Naegleria lovaniensis TaxID=51637 RepID=A0AA88KHA7_NAELO|nr:uncharacterized protein C9374_005958 [Naegleria lovaniensis]KAG2381574.1 hypothetical protein C9374_005958 [Naegleria lovaniensis]